MHRQWVLSQKEEHVGLKPEREYDVFEVWQVFAWV